MKFLITPRRLRGIAVVCVVAGLVALACRDANAPTRAPSNDAAMTPSANRAGVSQKTPGARARLSERNPQDWVGIAHNRGLDDFTAQLRARRAPPGNLCGFVDDFARARERMPADRRSMPAGVSREVARSTLRGTDLCARNGQAGVKHTSAEAPTILRPTPQASAEAYALVDQVDAALGVASSPDDLAARLLPILDASTGLAPVEAAAVQATVSVAQNSYEYWQSNLPAFVQQLGTTYGPCVSEYADTYASDDVRDRCLNGEGSWESRGIVPRGPATVVRLASLTPKDCNADIAASQKAIWRADARGAFGGFITGAIVAGLEGAIGGALIGGMVSSVVEGTGQAISLLWCMYQ